MHHFKVENGALITNKVEIANTLGAAIEKSSSENYSKEFQSIKAQKEKHKINFHQWPCYFEEEVRVYPVGLHHCMSCASLS